MSPPPRLVVLRPEPGNAATCAAARTAGFDPVAAPLFAIEPVAWNPPEPTRFDALLLGSANALRHGGGKVRQYAGLPVYAVGEATANAASAAGFPIAAVGEDGIQPLLAELVRDERRAVLRLAGEAHVALAPPQGCAIETVIVYRAQPLSLAAVAVAALREGAPALLHSADAARHFAAECGRLCLARGELALACLGPRVATAAGSGWAEVAATTAFTDAALLALAGPMCQTAASGVARSSRRVS